MNTNTQKTTFRTYIIGFSLSVILTTLAYLLVTQHVFTSTILISAIIVLALVQLVVQLIFFLHLGKGSNSRWNIVIFLSTIGIIFIVVTGSIWIMNHLNRNMTPKEMNQYVQNQDGL